MFICRKNTIINSQNLTHSELILNPDGSVYHLHLLPDDIGDLIITVGDPERVQDVSAFFDSIELKKRNREFETHTGRIGNQRITCLSTGMGTDNIDIVMNELDALVNIDLANRKLRPETTSLTIVRIGTSGSINEKIMVGDIVFTEVAIGLEGLLLWYRRKAGAVEQKWEDALQAIDLPVDPVAVEADSSLIEKFSTVFKPGITLTAPGFYAPQQRELRLPTTHRILDKLGPVRVDGKAITNLEMETAGIYGLGKLLGHRCMSINAILADRLGGGFTPNPRKIVQKTIKQSLDVLCR